MEFFIKKNANLPILKMQVVQDGRSDYMSFMRSLEFSSIYFSMIDVETGIPRIVSSPASIVPLILANGAPTEYYIYYQFTERQTSKVGRFKGEFLIKNEEGDLILPLREDLYINIQDSFISKTNCC